jgi:hypothetical protein
MLLRASPVSFGTLLSLGSLNRTIRLRTIYFESHYAPFPVAANGIKPSVSEWRGKPNSRKPLTAELTALAALTDPTPY